MKQGDCFLFHLFTVSLKCHTGQYVQSQALQLTVDSFGKQNFLVAYGKMFWSSEDRVRARFHYAESRQNKP